MELETIKKAKLLGSYLEAQGKKVATAESCTGGGIACAITEVPGSSKWFDLALVTYSNEMKSKMLAVHEETLRVYGAVSEEVVRAMHAGAIAASGADLAVAVSGVAGPGGGTAEKPLGTVCLAWGSVAMCHVERVVFPGTREAVRKQTVNLALQRLVEFLQVNNLPGGAT